MQRTVNYAGAEGNRVDKRTRLIKLLRWMNYHGFLFGFVSYSFSIVIANTILRCWPPTAAAPTALVSVNPNVKCGDMKFETALNLVRVTGAAAVATGVFQIMHTVLAPFQRLGVFWLSVLQILVNDLSTFLLIFVLVFCTFGTVLLIIYPVGQPLAPQFDEVSTALTGMIQLAFTGEPLALNMSRDMWEEVSFNDHGALRLGHSARRLLHA